MNNKIIGLFGGTFNPPHKGHLSAAKAFCKAMNIDTLYVCPSYITPLKTMQKYDKPEIRFELASLCFNQLDFPFSRLIISDIELLREECSYTIDTVDLLLEMEKVDKIYIFVGSDMFFTLEKWKSFERLFEKCVFVTCPREHGVLTQQISIGNSYKSKYGANIHILDIYPFEISSSQIRELVCSAENYSDFCDLKNVLTETVLWYIINNGLYGCSLAPEDILRQEIKNYIKDNKRLAHIYGVEKRAAFLAEFFKDSIPDYREFLKDLKCASLLHDITKESDFDGQVRLFNEYGISLNENELLAKGVHHSLTGAFFSRQHFLVNQRIFDAVFYHTTGRENMSLMEKIIFIADYTEETRSLPEAVCLAKKMDEQLYNGMEQKALDSAIVSCLNATVRYLNDRGMTIHPNTLNAIKFFEENTPVGQG